MPKTLGGSEWVASALRAWAARNRKDREIAREFRYRSPAELIVKQNVIESKVNDETYRFSIEHLERIGEYVQVLKPRWYWLVMAEYFYDKKTMSHGKSAFWAEKIGRSRIPVCQGDKSIYNNYKTEKSRMLKALGEPFLLLIDHEVHEIQKSKKSA